MKRDCCITLEHCSKNLKAQTIHFCLYLFGQFAIYYHFKSLKKEFPQFNEQSESGVFKQQDAEECFSSIMKLIKQDSNNPDSNIFDGKIVSTIRCIEKDTKEAVETVESTFDKIKCHITIKTDFLSQGIENSLTETFEKRGKVSSENLKWQKESKITVLPKYLFVQLVRFFWKQEKNKKTKIMRV